jgi:hypothetical protein
MFCLVVRFIYPIKNKTYLDWFYPTIGNTSGLDFAVAGVWPGFDDRNCSWGQNRLIDRKNGDTYNSTWSYPINYSGTLPLKWVYIETWNDWNEGSEIEPSTEFDYQYLISTSDHIKAFNGKTMSTDNLKFEAAKKIYAASDSIEKHPLDSIFWYPHLKKAINYFILNQPDSSICEADNVINKTNIDCATDIIENILNGVEIYPNPAYDKLYIKMESSVPYIVQVINIQGGILLDIQKNSQLETLSLSNIPKGIYAVRILYNNKVFVKKIIIQ